MEPSAHAQHEPDAPPTPAPVTAALWYASIGVPVFPLGPGTKIPFPRSHGVDDATTDPYAIRAWWDVAPHANIGLATGHAFDAIDIDGPAGQASRTALWDAIFGDVDQAAYAKVLTPRAGGMHIYIPVDPDGRNGAAMADGIDYRGRGGYVVAPPSVTNVGRYRFLGAVNIGGTDSAPGDAA